MNLRNSVVTRCGTAAAVIFFLLAASFLGWAQASTESGMITSGVSAGAKGGVQVQNPLLNQQSKPAPAAQNAPAPSTVTQVNEPQMGSEEAPPPLRVMVGKSILVNTADRLRRVSVTDPLVADALVVTPNQVLVHGRAPGEVSLVLWDEKERSRSFDLRVDVDVTSAREEVNRIFPGEKVDVSASRNAVVLSGHVATKEDSDRVGLIAGAFSKNVVNVLTFGPVGAQEVQLEVKFAEVDRAAISQWGINLLSTGAGNTIGATSTQQFGPLTGSNSGALPPGVTGGSTVPGSNLVTGGIGALKNPSPSSFGANDLLNIFLFRPDLNLGVLIKALQQKNILQILAEPNLIAVNGKEASFLAGGEFPFPIVQSGSGTSSISIMFKEFGVRLKFLPTIMPNGAIHLMVNPEVSSLDFSNALQISGFFIPALSTRRAQTELELQDGQSFVIAGLMDNRVTSVINKVPGLGDIPILGNLFKSKNLQKNHTELMVLVTARLVKPTTVVPAEPKVEIPYMNVKPDGKSDSKAGSGGQ